MVDELSLQHTGVPQSLTFSKMKNKKEKEEKLAGFNVEVQLQL